MTFFQVDSEIFSAPHGVLYILVSSLLVERVHDRFFNGRSKNGNHRKTAEEVTTSLQPILVAQNKILEEQNEILKSLRDSNTKINERLALLLDRASRKR